jgi:hypothetical protein
MLLICIGFNADPDPAFLSMRIRIRIQIQGFDDQKLEKIYSCNKIYIFFDQKLQFT